MSGFTSNANLTGYRYGNVGTVGEQFPNVPIQAAVTGTQTVTLNLFSNTSTVYNPTILPGEVFVSLNQLASTTTVYNPTILPGATTINLDRVESTTTVYNPTVIQPGALQTINLDLLGSTTQIFLPTVELIAAITDTSDILDRYRKRKSESKEEEEIAAQLLKARQKRPKIEEQRKQLIDWKKRIYDAIYGAETISEVEAIQIPTVPTGSPEIVAALLAEIEQQKAARKLELKAQMQQAALASVQLENQIASRIEEQKAALAEIKRLQEEVMNRHAVAVQAAQQLQAKAFEEFQIAEQKALEFTTKRNNRIKRLKALMWLAKLDL